MATPTPTGLDEIDVLAMSRAASSNLIQESVIGNTFMMNLMRGIFLTGQQLVGAKAAQELAVSAQAREVLQGNAAANAPRETKSA